MLPWPPVVRAQPDRIHAPPFPRGMPWVNVAPLRMDKQAGRPVLIEFWDFCRVNSLRTLPYLKAWHERYAADGLRVIGVHAGALPPARDEANVRRAVERLAIKAKPAPKPKAFLRSEQAGELVWNESPDVELGWTDEMEAQWQSLHLTSDLLKLS